VVSPERALSGLYREMTCGLSLGAGGHGGAPAGYDRAAARARARLRVLEDRRAAVLRSGQSEVDTVAAPAGGVWLVAVAALAAVMVTGVWAAGMFVLAAGELWRVARIDLSAGVIPNAAVGRVAAVVVLAAAVWSVQRSVPVGVLAAGAGWGVVLSGAGVWCALWLARPAWIGAGDWKLLAVLGAGLGAVSLPAVVVMSLSMAAAGLLFGVWCWPRRLVVVGPAAAAGWCAGVVSVLVFESRGGLR
jgi:hypothetical protein